MEDENGQNKPLTALTEKAKTLGKVFHTVLTNLPRGNAFVDPLMSFLQKVLSQFNIVLSTVYHYVYKHQNDFWNLQRVLNKFFRALISFSFKIKRIRALNFGHLKMNDYE